jgi:ankyrin repeat protein
MAAVVSDALPIPPHAHASRYEQHAQALAATVDASEAALREWAEAMVADATVAVSAVADTDPPLAAEHAVDRLVRQWRRSGLSETTSGLERAHTFLADAHGFAAWDLFIGHVTQLGDPDSPTSRFEAAVDAIVGGDVPRLAALLAADPRLVERRSDRAHRSTLLHYVAANGVEDFRQATPPNIVAIATLLLDAGADVNAESEAYGGGATALGLAATSLHPQRAGVQLALLDLLLARGAWIDRPGAAGNQHDAVLGCLANGQPEAATHLANRGAALHLVSAAGVGRLDVVEAALRDQPDQATIQNAFMYACGYGHLQVAERLLQAGAEVAVADRTGETPLHWASGGLHPAVVAMLLRRSAPVDARDTTWDGTPLEWALYTHTNERDPSRWARARDVAAHLIGAGAEVRPEWPGPRMTAALQRDPDMARLLGLAIDRRDT